jgi:hypothetical protein
MKKVLLFSVFLVLAGAAFAQGKVSLQMDLPLLFGPPEMILASDAAFAGQPVPNNGNTLPSRIVLVVGLYGGTSSASLSLQGTAALNPPGGNGTPDGFIPLTHLITTLPGGVLGYFQVKVWDSAYATYEAQAAAGHVNNSTDYCAVNNIFTMTPGSSISYPAIINGGNTTWTAVGNEDENALPITTGLLIPEPSVLALAALGAAMLLMRRWRTRSHNH